MIRNAAMISAYSSRSLDADERNEEIKAGKVGMFGSAWAVNDEYEL